MTDAAPAPSFLEDLLNHIKTFFEGVPAEVTKDYHAYVLPFVDKFLAQFSSDFGKTVIAYLQADGAAIVAGVIAGETPIAAAAEAVLGTVFNDAIGIAKTDATTVVLNAIRTQLPTTTAPANPA